jgi:predicted nucleotidyltransferase
LSQAELARRGGTSQPAVARYESGAASPSVRTLERLLHAAGQRLMLSAEPAGATASFASERMRRLRAARPSLERATRRIGASNLRVFGSVARGDDRPDSDVDLLVDFDVHTQGALPLIRLRREFSDLLGEQVDLAAVDLLLPEVAARALTEAVPL